MPAGEMPDDKAAWVRRILGVEIPSRGATDGLAAWKTARAAAIATLNQLAGAVGKLDIPEAAPAVILLRAIRANLTESPTTPQQVAELRRYLETDDIIEEAEEPNGFGIKVDVRDPLLSALAGVKPDGARTGA